MSSNNIMKLNLYSDTKQKLNHFSYIKNINTLSKVFQCADCHTFLSEAKKMTRHLLTCKKGEQKIIFEEGNYSPKPSIFEKLEEHGIFVERELRFYPYYVFYDFETYLNDSNPNHKLIGQMMKLLGNSAYGKSIINFLKHEKVKILSEDKYNKNIRMSGYKSHEDLYKGLSSTSKRCLLNRTSLSKLDLPCIN